MLDTYFSQIYLRVSQGNEPDWNSPVPNFETIFIIPQLTYWHLNNDLLKQMFSRD